MINIEIIAHLILVFGTILDQASTRYVLGFPHIYENNPTTVWLMAKSLWLPFDLVIVVVSMLTTHFMYKKYSQKVLPVFLYTLVLGALRVIAGLHNLSLII